MIQMIREKGYIENARQWVRFLIIYFVYVSRLILYIGNLKEKISSDLIYLFLLVKVFFY